MVKTGSTIWLVTILLAVASYPSSSLAQESRMPPQSAIDACAGQSEGTACEVSTPDGTKSGDCAYTPDNKYFACRPERGDSNRSASSEGDQRDEGQQQKKRIRPVNTLLP